LLPQKNERLKALKPQLAKPQAAKPQTIVPQSLSKQNSTQMTHVAKPQTQIHTQQLKRTQQPMMPRSSFVQPTRVLPQSIRTFIPLNK